MLSRQSKKYGWLILRAITALWRQLETKLFWTTVTAPEAPYGENVKPNKCRPRFRMRFSICGILPKLDAAGIGLVKTPGSNIFITEDYLQKTLIRTSRFFWLELKWIKFPRSSISNLVTRTIPVFIQKARFRIIWQFLFWKQTRMFRSIKKRAKLSSQ